MSIWFYLIFAYQIQWFQKGVNLEIGRIFQHENHNFVSGSKSVSSSKSSEPPETSRRMDLWRPILSHMTFPGHLTDCTRQDTQRAVDYITRRESTNFIHWKKWFLWLKPPYWRWKKNPETHHFFFADFHQWHLLMTSQYPFINENPPSPEVTNLGIKNSWGIPIIFRSGFPFGQWWILASLVIWICLKIMINSNYYNDQ